MKKENLKIATSILSGDFGKMADEAKRIEQAGADYIHIDIMDGHFVPNLTMGPQMVSAINRATNMFLDVHLMIYNPYEYVERFIQAGADQITFHFEATEDVEATLEYIRRCNVQAGLAFCPETSASFIPQYLNQCDNLLIMTVHPGFGGQAFMPEVLEKISFVRGVCNQLKIFEKGIVAKNQKEEASLKPFNIQVDGGITDETAKSCVEAGANVLVAGTYLFHDNMSERIERLRNCGE